MLLTTQTANGNTFLLHLHHLWECELHVHCQKCLCRSNVRTEANEYLFSLDIREFKFLHQKVACRQLSTGLPTIVSKFADDCQQACRQSSAGNYPEEISGLDAGKSLFGRM